MLVAKQEPTTPCTQAAVVGLHLVVVVALAPHLTSTSRKGAVRSQAFCTTTRAVSHLACTLSESQLRNDADSRAAPHLISTTNDTDAPVCQIQRRTVRFSGEGR